MMKLRLLAEWWKDGRQHTMDLMGPIELSELKVMMRYGSDWQNSISIGPFDVSEINSIKFILVLVDNE